MVATGHINPCHECIMSSLKKLETQFDLTKMDKTKLVDQIVKSLKGRVDEAYLFGSFAKDTYSSSSDIDIILIKETTTKFIKRPMEFDELFDIFPNIDVLVYTKKEFERLLQDASIGFWKSVKDTLKKII